MTVRSRGHVDRDGLAETVSPVAAVVHAERGAADRLLVHFAAELDARGLRARGLVQDRTSEGKAGVVLVDLESGKRFRLFQDLGGESTSCSFDTTALSSASAALRRAVDERADVVFANRFGELEAEGRGLAAEMLAVMAEGIPLVTIVSDAYLPSWRRFTDGAGSELPARLEALEGWFAGIRSDSDGSDSPDRTLLPGRG